MPHPRIDPSRIRVFPLAQRRNLVELARVAIDPDSPPPDPGPLAERLDLVMESIRQARKRGVSRILAYGAHTIKNGCGPLLIRLIETGWLTHLSTQGAGIIHDWELAFQGATSESVRENAPVGRFGTWDETGRNILAAVIDGAAQGRGFGESIGHHIHQHPKLHPFADRCVAARAFENRVPLCVLPGIGYDIFCCHPSFTPDAGAAMGKASALDFHTIAHGVMNLTGGIYLSVGSAIMSPQCFEKAFSIANNLLEGEGKPFLRDHHVVVVDLQPSGGWDFSGDAEPPPDHPDYYQRLCKTFARMTGPHGEEAPGGRLDYIQADNRLFLHNLVARLEKE